MRAQKPIRSDIAWSTSDRIVVRGKDLPGEILGHMNLGDLAFLQITGRTATPEESNVFNAIVITLVEHGITPSAIVARMTYAGAPESLQAAVAAGLCGLGTVFVGSTEGATKMLYEALEDRGDTDLQSIAVATVAKYRREGAVLPGGNGGVKRRVSRNHDDDGVGVHLQKLFQRSQAPDARHGNVEQDNIVRATSI